VAETRRIEIGFDGGQVVAVRLEEEKIAGLRKAVERDNGWYNVDSEEGSVALDLGKVVFVRTLDAPHGIGFSGDG
jgi:hypothetical protein